MSEFLSICILYQFYTFFLQEITVKKTTELIIKI